MRLAALVFAVGAGVRTSATTPTVTVKITGYEGDLNLYCGTVSVDVSDDSANPIYYSENDHALHIYSGEDVEYATPIIKDTNGDDVDLETYEYKFYSNGWTTGYDLLDTTNTNTVAITEHTENFFDALLIEYGNNALSPCTETISIHFLMLAATEIPTSSPTPKPTRAPTPPTAEPTQGPTTLSPTHGPTTPEPSQGPSANPTESPTVGHGHITFTKSAGKWKITVNCYGNPACSSTPVGEGDTLDIVEGNYFIFNAGPDATNDAIIITDVCSGEEYSIPGSSHITLDLFGTYYTWVQTTNDAVAGEISVNGNDAKSCEFNYGPDYYDYKPQPPSGSGSGSGPLAVRTSDDDQLSHYVYSPFVSLIGIDDSNADPIGYVGVGGVVGKRVCFAGGDRYKGQGFCLLDNPRAKQGVSVDTYDLVGAESETISSVAYFQDIDGMIGTTGDATPTLRSTTVQPTWCDGASQVGKDCTVVQSPYSHDNMTAVLCRASSSARTTVYFFENSVCNSSMTIAVDGVHLTDLFFVDAAGTFDDRVKGMAVAFSDTIPPYKLDSVVVLLPGSHHNKKYVNTSVVDGWSDNDKTNIGLLCSKQVVGAGAVFDTPTDTGVVFTAMFVDSLRYFAMRAMVVWNGNVNNDLVLSVRNPQIWDIMHQSSEPRTFPAGTTPPTLTCNLLSNNKQWCKQAGNNTNILKDLARQECINKPKCSGVHVTYAKVCESNTTDYVPNCLLSNDTDWSQSTVGASQQDHLYYQKPEFRYDVFNFLNSAQNWNEWIPLQLNIDDRRDLKGAFEANMEYTCSSGNPNFKFLNGVYNYDYDWGSSMFYFASDFDHGTIFKFDLCTSKSDMCLLSLKNLKGVMGIMGFMNGGFVYTIDDEFIAVDIDADDVETLYNDHLPWTVDNDVYIPASLDGREDSKLMNPRFPINLNKLHLFFTAPRLYLPYNKRVELNISGNLFKDASKNVVPNLGGREDALQRALSALSEYVRDTQPGARFELDVVGDVTVLQLSGLDLSAISSIFIQPNQVWSDYALAVLGDEVLEHNTTVLVNNATLRKRLVQYGWECATDSIACTVPAPTEPPESTAQPTRASAGKRPEHDLYAGTVLLLLVLWAVALP